MKAPFFAKITVYWHKFKQWCLNTPERSLLEAYQAAEIIKNIEIEQFNNQKISPESGIYDEIVMSYWQVYLDKNLAIIKIRLGEFNLSRSFINNSDPIILKKLQFIDEVIAKYAPENEQISNSPLEPISQQIKLKPQVLKQQSNSSNDVNKLPALSQKDGVLPRSIGRTINRIKRDFSPQAEERFVSNYRITTNRTRSAIRFLLILMIVPLLTQHFSKQFLVNPIVERIRGEDKTQIFLNSEMETEALRELKIFEKKLKFESLISQAPEFSPSAIEEKVHHKAIEIAENFQSRNSGAISNVFADLISLITFGIIITLNKKEIVIVKSFLDEIVYGLSDSAKAFIIILLTDVFVGFHSPHGWEILLEGLAEHLGLPASRSAIFTFIATFPVILNTIFKYWIFRYLSRLSPSALATLKEMDE